MAAGGALAVQVASAAVLCARHSGALVMRSSGCQRTEARVDPAALGLQGPPGAKGDPGPRGPVPTFAVQTVVKQQAAGPGLQQTDATCPLGYELTGGGAGTGSGSSTLIDSDSCAANTWCVVYDNPPGGALNLAVAQCAGLQ